MVSVVDWYGVSAVIAAVFAGLATLVGAFNHRTVSNVDRKTDTLSPPPEPPPA